MNRLPGPARFVVAIPVRDEVERLQGCLEALDTQRGAACDAVVLVLNNCKDGSAELARRLRPELRLRLSIVSRRFPPEQANAGHARALAMRIAAGRAGPDGVIATTDADGAVSPAWVAGNRAALAGGAEVVCGRAVIDPVEARAIHPALHEDDAREVAYGTLLDEIHSRLDPDPIDPWPRHTEHSGASIAVTVAAWRRAGGLPAVPSGEDRAFIAALRAVDARIRHAPEVWVTVSGRLQGRAPGGMAETMSRRMQCQDGMLDADLEPASVCERRAWLRAQARRVWDTSHAGAALGATRAAVGELAAAATLSAASVERAISTPYFGAAWHRIEGESPVLRRIAVPRDSLEAQREAALHILAHIGPPAPAFADRAQAAD